MMLASCRDGYDGDGDAPQPSPPPMTTTTTRERPYCSPPLYAYQALISLAERRSKCSITLPASRPVVAWPASSDRAAWRPRDKQMESCLGGAVWSPAGQEQDKSDGQIAAREVRPSVRFQPDAGDDESLASGGLCAGARAAI
jgi:hypothetical protein